jgi:hypothetical protein
VIIDTFPFFNELDLLELRLNEHAAFVDKFVIAESCWTHQGEKKPLMFWEHRDEPRFQPFLDRIVHVVDTLEAPDPNPWTNERRQREKVKAGLDYHAQPGDVILHSDCDEIFRREAVEDYVNRGLQGIYWGNFDFFCYYMNLKNEGAFWPCPFICRWPEAGEFFTIRNQYRPPEKILPNAGWHFTWLGGEEAHRTKLVSFAHKEFNTAEYTSAEHIKRVRSGGYNLEGTAQVYQKVEIDGTFPRYLRENPERFRQYILS